jgi:mannose-6-phosphate isomerase-like protein (cupin superfamily)
MKQPETKLERECSGVAHSSAMNSIYLQPDEGERIPRGPRDHRVLAELPQLEVIDARFGPDFAVKPHKHEDHVDSFYVLEGAAEFTIGDEVVRAAAGTWVAVPVGTVHGFRNTGRGELRILNIHAPNSGFTERLRAQA